MKTIRNITALLRKDGKDCLKDKQMLVLFIVFPIIGWIMTQTIASQVGMDNTFFVAVFACMHAVFVPLVSCAGMLAEENEKGTFRSLRFANVTLGEYLTATGIFIWLVDLLTGLAFLPLVQGGIGEMLGFLGALSLGCLLSVILGGSIGLIAASTAAANSLAVPAGMALAFLPMLAQFSEPIKKFASLTYGGRVSELLAGGGVTVPLVATVVLNLAVLTAAALLLYRRNAARET